MFNIFSVKSNNENEEELTYSNLLKKIDKLTIENEDLKLDIKNYENDYLGTENQMLNDKVGELESLCHNLTQENGLMKNHIRDLDGEIESLIDINRKSNQDYLDLDNYNKVIVDSNKDLTEKNSIYKDVINVLCDKYDIKHEEVFKIIDNIKNEKDNKNEREK